MDELTTSLTRKLGQDPKWLKDWHKEFASGHVDHGHTGGIGWWTDMLSTEDTSKKQGAKSDAKTTKAKTDTTKKGSSSKSGDISENTSTKQDTKSESDTSAAKADTKKKGADTR